ncbi:class F sortase [Streptomyces sp. Tu 2975]|uniref:class F sortase n=1 Tax=Streptomyces sp. Tu 2975 TaxID=2676871 RepID=UPI001357A0C4|nr:class F sortase [Streptomyces sp. Tu 2975]QIP87719.1 class F sortase [Streptomyces sp. Tu 2975]
MALQQDPKEPAAKRSRGRRSLLWPLAAAALGIVLIYNSVGTTEDAEHAATPLISVSAAPGARPSAGPSAAPSASASTKPGLPRSEPTRLKILRIAVNAPFMPLSIGASGQLDAPPPDDSNLVGWFREGVTPGEAGTAIVAGHLDTKTGPGVFLALSSLEPGNLVDVVRKDGTTVTFSVDDVESFSKSDFPDDRVYADTADPQLRLITCGGEYDKKAKDYKENVVVFAHMVSSRKG